MKKILFTLSFLIFVHVKSFGQQNFFNIPSSDITLKNKLFYQQQLNFYRSNFNLNTTFSYGLGKGYEIGLNFNGIDFEKNQLFANNSSAPYFPFYLINGQKEFKLNAHLTNSFGFQTGIHSKTKWGSYLYHNYKFLDEEIGIKIVAGLYYSSNNYFGAGKRGFENDIIGFQMGIEKAIFPDKLYLQGDFLGGKNSFSETILGFAYKITPHWVISSGYQIPNTKNNPYGLIFELTRL